MTVKVAGRLRDSVGGEKKEKRWLWKGKIEIEVGVDEAIKGRVHIKYSDDLIRTLFRFYGDQSSLVDNT